MKTAPCGRGNNRNALIIPFYSPIIPLREVHLTRGIFMGKNVERSSHYSPVMIVGVVQ